MQLFEWGIASKAAGRPGMNLVGITGSQMRAQERMLGALGAVPAPILARGWVTALALGADRLTYDRLAVQARVIRDADGTVQWLTGSSEPLARPGGDLAGLVRKPARTAVISGGQLRELREARGLSRESLAWKAGLDVSTVARLERLARPSCRGRTVARLAEVLGEHPRALVCARLADGD